MAQKTSVLDVEIRVRSQKAQKQVKQTTEKFNDFRVATEGIRRDLGVLRNNLLLVSFAFGAVGRVMVDSIKKASDLQENINKFNVVFGEASNEAMGFADTLADTFQRSRPSIINMMASLQDTFVPLGFARKQASSLSQAVTQLTFDLESFSNVPAAEVARALQSAIVGNHETVRRFGIILSEHTIQQQAFALGIEKSYRELTEQEKVLARVRAIIKGSADAMGDALRTQDDYASQVRALTADFEELQIAFGEALIPFAQFMVQVSRPERVLAYTTAIAGLALGMTLVSAKARLASKGIVGVAAAARMARGALIKTGFGILAIGIGEVAARMMMAGDETDKLSEDLQDLDGVLDGVAGSIKTLTVNQDNLFKSMIAARLAEGNPELYKKLLKQLQDYHDQERNFELQHAINLRDARVEKYKESIQAIVKEYKELDSILQEPPDPMMDFFDEVMAEQSEKFKETTEAFKEFRTEIVSGDSARAQEELMNMVEPFKQFSDNLSQAVIHGRSLGDAVVASIKAIAAELLAQAATLGLMKVFFGTGVTAAGLGLDLLGGIGKLFGFHQGGMIGGQGQNVPIIAQPGEFVMQRSAVQSIGASNLAEMNATGQPISNITVNIQGGVVDQDYVANTLIPAINASGQIVA